MLRKTETDQPVQRGWELELRIPIFDFGSARTARAEYRYMQAVHRATDVAIRARSEVRESYSAYRVAFDLARHYRDEIVPLRKRRITSYNVCYTKLLRFVEVKASRIGAGSKANHLAYIGDAEVGARVNRNNFV